MKLEEVEFKNIDYYNKVLMKEIDKIVPDLK